MSASELHVEHTICAQRANDPDDEVIAALASRQGGVVARKQLLARGISARSIGHRSKIGRLRVIHRGVYAVGHDAILIRGRLCAALLVAGLGAALSHRTAAYVLALAPSMPQFVEVALPQPSTVAYSALMRAKISFATVCC
jgi:Transcriptional regulator, AbiEi antitoxin